MTRSTIPTICTPQMVYFMARLPVRPLRSDCQQPTDHSRRAPSAITEPIGLSTDSPPPRPYAVAHSFLAPAAFIGLTLLLIVIATGCGGEDKQPPPGVLQASAIRPALDTLPYRYRLKRIEPPTGDVAAFVGHAYGPHRTELRFSIALGGDVPIAVRGAGAKHAVWETAFGFVYNDNSDIYKLFDSEAQWQEAPRMAVAVIESLCRAASGEPCPV